MPGLPLEFWLIVAGIIGFAAIGSLRSLSAYVNHQTTLQDVTAQAERLRREYDRRLKDTLKDDEVLDEGEALPAIAQEALEIATHQAAA